MGVEAVSRSAGGDRPADAVENFVFLAKGDAATYEAIDGDMRAAVAGYWEAVSRLLRTLLQLSACALGLPPDHFLPSHAPGECSLRLAYYPPQMEAPAPRQMRYGEHTDYTGFTILRQDAPGLEVCPRHVSLRACHAACPPLPPRLCGHGYAREAEEEP